MKENRGWCWLCHVARDGSDRVGDRKRNTVSETQNTRAATCTPDAHSVDAAAHRRKIPNQQAGSNVRREKSVTGNSEVESPRRGRCRTTTRKAFSLMPDRRSDKNAVDRAIAH